MIAAAKTDDEIRDFMIEALTAISVLYRPRMTAQNFCSGLPLRCCC